MVTKAEIIRELGTRVNRVLEKTGHQIVPTQTAELLEADGATFRAVQPFTRTSNERILAVCDAVHYVERFDIPGAIVECGVWRGGAMMAAAITLHEVQAERDIYLFDTYEGMSEPTEHDVSFRGERADELLGKFDRPTDGADEKSNAWAFASLEDVQANMRTTGYPDNRLHYIVGKVEETLPGQAPDQIAILRLDTDWYESTKHELEHLVPRLSPNGVLIVDDYGHWTGARKAVDEFLDRSDQPILLNRTDYTGRMAVVPGTTSG